LLFAADRAAGCDLEKIVCRDPEAWERLLEAEGFALAKALAGASKTLLDDAATQVWSLKESLRKAGSSFSQPMCLSSWSPDGWASFSAGGFKATTFRTEIEEGKSAFAFGFVISSTP
jgi:enediyne polyketide synthase